MHCRGNHGIRWNCHVQISDQIYQETQRAGLESKLELPAFMPGSQSGMVEIFVESCTNGRRVVFDVSAVSSTQDAINNRATKIAASAIDMCKTRVEPETRFIGDLLHALGCRVIQWLGSQCC